MKSKEVTRRKCRPRLRFSLRTLLIVMLVACVLFGTLGSMALEARKQRHLVDELADLRGYISLTENTGWAPDVLDTTLCGRVTEIFSEGADFTDATRLAALTNLKQLILNDSSINDISGLSELKKMEVLELQITNVTDISPLAGLKKLRRLNLCQTPVTDITPLSNLTNLQELNLGDTQVGDISPLLGLKKLRSLDLLGTRISEEQGAELQKALPDCHIVFGS